MEINKQTYIASLIGKHLRGVLLASERKELDDWLRESEENEALFRRICSEKFLEEWRGEDLLFDTNKGYNRFTKNVEFRSKKRIYHYWGYVAAAAVLLIGMTVLFRISGISPEPETAAFPEHGCSMARLILDDGRVVEFSGDGKDTLFQGGGRLFASGKGIEYKTGSELPAGGYNELEVPRRGEFFLLLGDGTKVWLNSETRLRYPVAFSGNERVVSVEGEAYFEVHKDAARPFIVEMEGSGRVEVTGTSFNVHHYANEGGAQVTLVEGSVCLENGGEKVSLEPGEQGGILPGGKIGKKKVNISLYTAWKDGRFVFKEQPLEEIMRTVARWYDVDIVFENESVRQVTFSGNLRRYDDFGKIVSMLEAIGVARFKVEGNRICVSEYKTAD